MQKKNKQKINKLNILLISLATILGIVFLFLPIMSIIGLSNNLKIYHKIFDNTSTSQTSQVGKVKYVTDDSESNEPYLCKVDSNDQLMDDFKIMVTSDLHIDYTPYHKTFQIKVLSNLIDIEKPDLVVLDGDTISNYAYSIDTSVVETLVKMFEDKKQYYTFVLGNHDGQCLDDDFNEQRKIAFDILSGKKRDHTGEKSKYCLAESKLNVGQGINYINIRGKNKNIIQSLFFFDCLQIKELNQTVIDWYNQSLINIKNDNNGVLPSSIAFNHMPFYEFDYAINNIGVDPDAKYVLGAKLERFGGNKQANGLFDAFVNGGSTKTIVSGHDHKNNICVEYKNIRMMYTLGLQYQARNFRRLDTWQGVANFFSHIYSNKYDCYLDGATNILLKNAFTNPIYAYTFTQNVDAFKGIKNELTSMFNGAITFKSTALVWVNRIALVMAWGGVITCITFLVIRKKQAKISKK